MPDIAPSNAGRVDRLALTLACLGPVGRLPTAPGTWGSAAALIAAPFVYLPHSPLTRLVILAGLLALGTWAAGRGERLLGRHDPGCIVIDEVLGQWICLYPFSILPTWQVLAGFVLFRFFDIAKPWPVRWLERKVPGGLGIMLDDLAAGVWAAGGLWAARQVYLHWIA